jgi:large subunit ribosomal protein L23
MQTIIERPIITEKSMTQASFGWYTFAVAKHARKETIAKAIELSYKVNVIDIHTRNVHGKVRRVGRRMIQVAKPDWKKAMVKLKSGQHIDAFEISQQAQQEESPSSAKSTEGKKAEGRKSKDAK